MSHLRRILAGGTAIALVGFAYPAVAQSNSQSEAQNMSCLEKVRQIRNAMDEEDINARNEERVDALLRQARQSRRAGNDQQCQEQIAQAQQILRQSGVQVSFNQSEDSESNQESWTFNQRNRTNAQQEGQEQRQRTAQAGNDRPTARSAPGGGQIVVEDPQPEVNVTQPRPQVDVTQQPPEVLVRQPQPEIIVRQPAPQVSVRQAPPQVTVNQEEPEIIVRIPQPIVTIQQPEADVNVETGQPNVEVSDAKPKVRFIRPRPRVIVEEAEQAEVNVQQGEPQVNVRRTGEADANVQVEREEADVQFQRTGEPNVQVSRAEPKVNIQRSGEPNVRVERQEPQVRYERVGENEDAQNERGNQAQQRQRQAARQNQGDQGETERNSAQQRQSGENRTASNQQQNAADNQADAIARNQAEPGLTPNRQNMAANQNQADNVDVTAATSSTEDYTGHPLFNRDVRSIVGQSVFSARNENIGEIDEVVKRNGELFAVVSVGGFLGIGEHNVALPFERLSVSGNRITLPQFTQEELENMPEYNDSSYTVVSEQSSIREAVEE